MLADENQPDAQPSDCIECGRDYHFVSDLNTCLEESLKLGYHFICVPLIHPRLKREFISEPAKDRPGPMTRSDLLLNSSDWSTRIVCKISPWLDLDSENEIVRRNSEKALRQELLLASHLSISEILIELNGFNCFNLARMIGEHLGCEYFCHQFWIVVPMLQERVRHSKGLTHREISEESKFKSRNLSCDPWSWWNTLRTMCENDRVSLVLKLTSDTQSEADIERWCTEPVKAIVVSSDLFLTNRKGFPVLPKAQQRIVRKFLKLQVQLIVSGCVVESQREFYYKYITYLSKTQDSTGDDAACEGPTNFSCTGPLEPLKVNIQSNMYELFEGDLVKYAQYQKAVYCALIDRVAEENISSQIVIVMVLGAGRGPLVTAALRAADLADRRVRVYAVEKNPNAILTLENLKLDTWGDRVSIVSGDMRFWEAPEKADIIVSELLGSFGDNELSPECLDGAQRFVKDDCVSIPYQYTSYLSPISSSKLWHATAEQPISSGKRNEQLETVCIAAIPNSCLLDEAKPLFTFTHPKDNAADNNRFRTLEYDISTDTVLHGFSGYFYCVLYDDVTISIVPHKSTVGMISWHPLYFPIKNPIQMRKGDRLAVHFWRINNGKNVWYEWSVSEPIVQAIHNPNGRSFAMSL